MALKNKELRLLKPDIREGYFDVSDRKREKYCYLHVSGLVSKDALEADIKAGAKMYKPCLDYLEGVPSRFVVIECDSREEGLRAVSYISGISSEGNMDCSEILDDPYSYSVRDDKSSDATEDLDDDEQSLIYDEWGEEYEEQWYDHNDNIPVIGMQEICAYENGTNSFSGFGSGFNGFQAGGAPQKQDPYWTNIGRGEIVITDFCDINLEGELTINQHGFVFGDNDWVAYFKRFSSLKRVYYLLIRRQTKVMDFEDDDNPFTPDMGEDYTLSRILLEYAGVHVSLTGNKNDTYEYNLLLFKNWLERYQLQLEKGFPLKAMLSQVIKLDVQAPSASEKKVIDYIVARQPDIETVCRSHFEQMGVLKNTLSRKKEPGITAVREEDLVGMEEVKRQFEQILLTMKFTGLRRQRGLPCINNHNVFLLLGAPGTAKTTMAQLMGMRMKEEKLLSGTRFGSFSGAQLKAEYLGQTAHRVHSIFEKHDIILIDEAYSLAPRDGGRIDMYGQEALAQLAIELENHGNDRLIFFAGYGGTDVNKKNNMMREFLDANPGIKSRINATIVFPSYTADQMLEISVGIAKNYGYRIEERAKSCIREYFSGRVNDDNFGNGREARSFVENCQMILAERLLKKSDSNPSKAQMQLICYADVQKAIYKLIQADTAQTGRLSRAIGFK